MDLGPNLHAKIFATNLMHSWVFKRTRPVFVLCICLSELSLFHEDQSNQRAKPSFDFAISNQSSKKMTVEVSNGAADALSYPNGDVKHQNPSSATALQKSREAERRRRRRKQKKKNKASVAENGNDSDTAADDDDNAKENGDLQKALEQVEVEYVPEKAELDGDLDDEFRKVFEKFSFKETAGSEENDKKDETATNAALAKKADSDSDEEEQDTQQKDKGFSNKKKKLQRRMKIAELKQICSRPDVVEVWDATASDPKLLVFLKSYRNTVPVPRHWCQKRKFLQREAAVTIMEPGYGKRGIEKQPFQLPDFIAATGIEKIRQAYIEKEDSKKLKQKQRERMQPKMGKMDIDYQVLHDAFFKYQTKPKLTTHGDLYHEGKEFEEIWCNPAKHKMYLRGISTFPGYPGLLNRRPWPCKRFPLRNQLNKWRKFANNPLLAYNGNYGHLVCEDKNQKIFCNLAIPGYPFSKETFFDESQYPNYQHRLSHESPVMGENDQEWYDEPPMGDGDDFYNQLSAADLDDLSDRMYGVKLREMKPGMLSHELKEALGMPEGAPPPWLINMQRYGPPPSYPHLKIPGLNAPIPLGASFGYHPGGWGKPPVDEFGRPLYGDVFGVQQQEQPNYEEEPVDKTKHWGDLEEEEEEEEEEDEEEVEEQIEEEELEAGIQSVDSLSSTPTGVETPDVIDLRKQQRKEPEKPLYQVLEEKEEKIAPGTLLGTSHTYVIGTGTQDKTAAAKRVDLLRGQKSDRVDVTLQPEELEVMDNVLHAKYEEAREEEKLRSQREDFSDMVAENANKRKRKMQEKEGKSKKKDFKF
ncbi:unnamed protein product [Camellia sinensis]